MSAQVSLQTLLSEHTMESAPELVRSEPDGALRCLACGHRCKIYEGKQGVCRVRFRSGDRLLAPAGYVAGLQIDPIEKKPFFHVFPGTDALSFGMLGCDLHCGYCQNWVTSQALRDDQAVSLPRMCSAAQLAESAVENNVPVVVSTYNEPLITADWAVEVFKVARSHGVRCGFVSNGNATPEVLEFIRPYVDLYKVDLKTFDDRKYRSLGGTLQNVLDSIQRLVDMGFWVEIVTLIVPGFNDSEDELKRIASFLAGVSTMMPWHVTAFHPDYKMTDPDRTPAGTLARAHEIGTAAGLKYVYAGNLPGALAALEDTRCHACGATLIRRVGFQVVENRMSRSRCGDCGAEIPGLWQAEAAPRIDQALPRAVRLT